MSTALIRSAVIAALCASTACAASAADAPAPGTVVATSTMPDLARTRERWKASIYGRIWALPALAGVRTKVSGWSDGVAASYGFDPMSMLIDATVWNEQYCVPEEGADEGTIGQRYAVELPTRATEMWKAITEHGESEGQAISLLEFRCRRYGDQLVVAKGCEPIKVATPKAAVGCDTTAHADISAVIAALGGAEALPVLKAIRLSTIDYNGTITDDGSKDAVVIPGFRLPFAALDGAALAGLPEQPLLLLAAGIDGLRLDALITDGAQAIPDSAAALAQADAELAKLKLPKLHDLVVGLSGTAYLAVTSGVPFPAVTIAIPATPQVDASVLALSGARGVDLSHARDETVMLPLPNGAPVMVLVRRTATHWVLSSDPMLLDAIAAPDAKPFDLAAHWSSVVAQGARPEALVWQDNRGLAQLALGLMPMMAGTMRRPDQRDLLQQVQAGLTAAMPLLRPSITAVIGDAKGTIATMQNGMLQVGTLGIMAGAALPAIAMTRKAANRTRSGNNIRQIIIASLAWANDNEGKFPLDLAELRAAGGLDDALFHSPSNPRIDNPYCYVRPTPEAGPLQPM
ncbi:MAG: hypothetical protein H0W83_07160, partial [Planctomycetes bacterium]|nr:hypothetical protein [Planctomycetota bacterium]